MLGAQISITVFIYIVFVYIYIDIYIYRYVCFGLCLLFISIVFARIVLQMNACMHWS